MSTRRALILVAALSPLPAVGDGPAHSLRLSVSVPDVTISPSAGQRRFLRLPSLDFSFRVEASCRRGYDTASVSLAIADSRIAIDTSTLSADGDAPRVSLTVPASQLAPLVIGEFCRAGEQPATADTVGAMTVSAALLAQASLRCRAGDAEEVTYVAEPLAVRLLCEDGAVPED